MDDQKRHYKAIQIGDRSEIVYAIFDDEKEYCKPCFNSIQSAGKAQYSQRLIYIPMVFDHLIMFAVQMESEPVKQADFSK